MTIAEWLKSAAEALEQSGCPDPAVDARWIAEDALRMSPSELHFESRNALRPDQLEEMNRIFEVPEEEQLHAEQFTPVSGGDVIELGGCPVRVLEMPGHTPGSVIFVDEGHKVVFTGDAVGSGVGVWMQLPNCCCRTPAVHTEGLWRTPF